MSMIDKNKAQIDLLKFAIGLLVAIGAPLFGWSVVNYTTENPLIIGGAILIVVIVAITIPLMIHAVLKKINELEEM